MHLLPIITIYLSIGIFAGFLSGLLGVGGGLVMVPGLMIAFHLENMDPHVRMHVAIATSLAAMVFVTARSLLSHMKRKPRFFGIYKQLAPTMIIGVIAGSILTRFLHSIVLQILFGLFVLIMALSLFLKTKVSESGANLPGKFGMGLAGAFVGLQSSFFGIGGATFTVPFLSRRGVDMRVAVVVGIAMAMTVATLGAIAMMVTGWSIPNLPAWHTGYVYWPAWLGMAIGGFFIAPLGATLSHRISPKKLKLLFALFLFCVAAHMLWV